MANKPRRWKAGLAKRLEREARADNEAARFYVSNAAWREAQRGVPFHGNPVAYEARYMTGGHNNPTYAYAAKVVDGKLRPLGRRNVWDSE